MRNQRQEAWAYGRAFRDQLVSLYREEYGVDVPRPPAMIVDELLTDFLGVTLHFDPLSLQIYAQTEWIEDHPVVTVNSLTEQIPGVKDVTGVQNVAKFHEAVHVDRDLSELKPGPQLLLPEFAPPTKIVCHRGIGLSSPSRREFWAEEAGRAAAVSYEGLARSDAFRAFIRLSQVGSATANGERWTLLYRAAKDIGINISALVKQLELEGQIVVQKEGGRQVIHPQPSFLGLMEGR
ncbi:MAG: hypothetical protein O2909_12675 [Chloroflexi bacterium]|nr:hypothetical protein [Chloroflexota bacterium]